MEARYASHAYSARCFSGDATFCTKSVENVAVTAITPVARVMSCLHVSAQKSKALSIRSMRFSADGEERAEAALCVEETVLGQVVVALLLGVGRHRAHVLRDATRRALDVGRRGTSASRSTFGLSQTLRKICPQVIKRLGGKHIPVGCRRADGDELQAI